MRNRVCLIGSFLVPMVVAALGCSPAGPPTGTVAGKATVAGGPLGSGSVALYSSSNGYGAMATVAADGTFSFEQPVPTGSYRFYVVPPTPTSTDPGTMPVIGPEFAKIPPHRLAGETSDVILEVKTGANELELPF